MVCLACVTSYVQFSVPKNRESKGEVRKKKREAGEGKEEQKDRRDLRPAGLFLKFFIYVCVWCHRHECQKRTSDPLELELGEVMIVLHGCWEQISMEDYKSPWGTLFSHSCLILVSKDVVPHPNTLTYTLIFERLPYCHKNITETERAKQAS